MTPDEFLKSMKAARKDLEAAEDARDTATLTTMYQHIRAAMPPDLPKINFQAISYTAVTRLLEAEAWDEAAHWLVKFEQGYGPDFYDVEFAHAVLEWHTGNPTHGKTLLQQVYRTHGTLPFRGFERYLAIARDNANALPPHTDTDDTLDIDHPLIQDLTNRINTAMDNEHYTDAIELCRQALHHLDDPATTDGPMWFLATAGEAYFAQGDYQRAHDAFDAAHRAQGGHTNPLVLLRLGECHIEHGNTDTGIEHLIAAHIADPTALEHAEPHHLEPLHQRGLP
ncbi:tetratricopeptide repeat protein [Propioniferax innocua]|uniref:Uncharacterized protein n=1 Tax=Propioniferax innocua TaxID=1753 RepID=A0A542ZS00_9ACTN|nr:tetratricopeptide repeat protein [Propioniferax innocua]TQL63029.1 hypothetical protein FB460_0829 [Propioniferax innocua]